MEHDKSNRPLFKAEKPVLNLECPKQCRCHR